MRKGAFVSAGQWRSEKWGNEKLPLNGKTKKLNAGRKQRGDAKRLLERTNM